MRKIIFTYSLLFLFIYSSYSQQWEKVNVPDKVKYDIWDVVMLNKLQGCAAIWDARTGADARILTTSDGGKNWSESYSQIFRGATAIDRLDNNTVVAVGGANNYLSAWKSTNGGNSFSPLMQDDQFIQGKPSFWAVDFVNTNIGYGGTTSGKVLKTTDGGQTWNYINNNFTLGCIVTMNFVNENLGFLAISNQDYDQYRGKDLYKTTNGGKNWEKVFSAEVIRKILFLDENIGFCVGSSGSTPRIWKTIDGGVNWKVVMSSNPEVYWMSGITFTDNQYIGYAAGGHIGNDNEGAIFRTIDGGETWTKEIGGLDVCFREISFFEETNGVAVGNSGIIYYIERDKEPPFEPSISLNKSEIDLGFADYEQEKTSSLRIKAKNPAGLKIINISAGENEFESKGFSIDLKNKTLPIDLKVGEEFTFDVKFKNSEAGVFESKLKITTNDSKKPDTLLNVICEVLLPDEPIARISVDEINFETIKLNQKVEKKLKIYSETYLGLEIKNITIENNLDNQFSVISPKKLPFELIDIDSIEVKLIIDAKAEKLIHTNLVITSNDTENPIIKIPVVADIITNLPPKAKFSLSEVDFNKIQLNKEKETDLKIKSDNTAGLEIQSISIDNNSDNLFEIKSNLTYPVKINKIDSLGIIIRVNPTKEGIFNRNLIIKTNDPANSNALIPLKVEVTISSVRFTLDANDISIYPNPIGENLQFEIHSDFNQMSKIKVVGLKGENIIEFDKYLKIGLNKFNYELNNFTNGTYYLVVETNNEKIIKNFIK